MSRFPETDSSELGDVAVALSDPKLFELAHSNAEGISSLYKFGHTGLRATFDSLELEPVVNTAIQTGIQAYEGIGSIILSNDVHRRYTSDYIIEIISDYSPGSNFKIDFLETLDEAYSSMVEEMPNLSYAVARLIACQLGDTSQELRHRGLEGAVIMRSVQLEVDQLLAFEADVAGEDPATEY